MDAIDTDIDAGVYGVDKRCPFLQLSYFGVTQSFPPALMHDLLEGVIPLLMKLVLQSLHSSKIITIAQVNAAIAAFSFGKNDKGHQPVSLPLTIASGTGSVLGSATEKLSLFMLLSMMIGHSIPSSNKPWQLYLQLRKVMDYLMCHRLPEKELPYLQMLVEDFAQNFVDCFPGNVTPKLHYLLHYPRLTSQYGPLRYLWCMRFEAKHQYFKKLARASQNYANLAHTLAKRHQLLQCWELAAPDFLGQAVKCTGESHLIFSNLNAHHRASLLNYLNSSHIDASEVVWKCSSLTRDGVTIKVQDVFILKMIRAENVPLFFKIAAIYKLRHDFFLAGNMLTVRSFSSHYHAYVVTEGVDVVVCRPADMVDSQVLDAYTLPDGKNYITLRYMCFETN